MHFRIARTTLLRQLSSVAGATQRGGAMPILENVLLNCEGSRLTVKATDLEIELQSVGDVSQAIADGAITVPSKKLIDIVRALPDAGEVTVKLSADKVAITCGKGRYTLSTLPATEFPEAMKVEGAQAIRVEAKALRRVMDRVSVAMAKGDVRTYLNGMLLKATGARLECVASDGHRLAVGEVDLPERVGKDYSAIVPRKGIAEIISLLPQDESAVTIEAGTGQVRVAVGDTILTTRLVAGTFPDFERVIPTGFAGSVSVSAGDLREAVRRAALLAEAKYNSLRLSFTPEGIRLHSKNEGQGSANEDVAAQTTVPTMDFGINHHYLADALDAFIGETACISVRDATTSLLVHAADDKSIRHVVMPMRL
ncbi:DNA polymerase III subunit beta [Rhodanobacter denitrificans]|uniref:DNA polymerase III subunit beta n=1 Tax=Rhodanobacter denitrificans TaxID=666685 RepID=UPI001F207190|nr:DNA polymerase III subunit beta [Rhodanobacter denitrificans]UJJ60639.1 DNA polymerase III subunit beta [Rhodanobacter denitrificans]